MKKLAIYIIIIAFTQSVSAQYLNEIGFLVGGSNYSGDIGDEMFIKPNALAGGIIYRRNLNTRLTLRGTLNYYQLKDNDLNSSNEVRQLRGISFTNNLTELTAGIEINYLDYDITSYRNTFTPYIFVELAGYHYYQLDEGSTQGSETFHSAFNYSVPLGLGFKTRITNTIGFVTEFRARYALTDNLDYENNSIPVYDYGNSRYNDWYFFVGAGLTFSFERPPCSVKPRY